MVEFDEVGAKTWDKKKVWRLEKLCWWDEELGRWDTVILGRTEFLTARKMRKMLKAI